MSVPILKMLPAIAVMSPAWTYVLMLSHYNAKLRGELFIADLNPLTQDDFVYERLRGTQALARYIAVKDLASFSFLVFPWFCFYQIASPGRNLDLIAVGLLFNAYVFWQARRIRAYKRRRFGI